ncbi:MAG TPA: NAD(P)H-binding protein [Vicinamibacteria bacterium]|nr:NAD(P)H-binding protein [Vicinamibacteria bacterium]
MRVVVAGGTGFIGREVVRQLLEPGTDQVTVTTRDPDRDLWGGRVRLVQAFAGDPVSLGRAFQGADVVVQAIQFPNHPVEDPSRGWTYLEVDGRGSSVAAQTAKKLGVRRFVYLSGAGAGQGRPQPWYRAKDQAEAAIRETGMEFVFLRPSWVYGPGDRSMSRFVSFCRYLPVVPVIGDGQAPCWPVLVEDLARAVVDCVKREEEAGKALEVGGPERLTMDDVVHTIARVLGKRRLILHHPVGLMKLVARAMLLLPNPILSPGAVDFVTQVVEMDPRPAAHFLGLRFRTLEQGLRGYLG